MDMESVCVQLLPRNIFSSKLWFTVISKKYIFPVQFIVGTTTNLLNFIILNSKELRTKSNNFLAVMAFVDFLFFLTLFPHSLAAYKSLEKSFAFVQFYYLTIIPVMTCSNWLSMTSNWLIVAVTVERVLAVRFPLRAKYFCNRSRIAVTILTIFILSFVLTGYQYASRKTVLIPYKNNNTVDWPFNCTYQIELTNSTKEPTKAEYVKISTMLHMTTSIVIPLILLIWLNSVLILFLKKNRQEMLGKDAGDNRKFGPLTRLSQEVKITVTVVVLIVAFIIFNLPSGLIHTIELFAGGLKEIGQVDIRDVGEFCNVLVITQKSLNFFLYCFSSAAFRSRLRKLLVRQFFTNRLQLDPSKRRANSRTSVTFIANSQQRRYSAHSGGSLSNGIENGCKSRLTAMKQPLNYKDFSLDTTETEPIRMYGGVEDRVAQIRRDSAEDNLLDETTSV